MAASDDPTFTQLSEVDHVLTRPEVYVGTVGARPRTDVVCDAAGGMARRDISVAPALVHLVNELLMNGVDNVARPRSGITGVDVDVDAAAGSVTVRNDGRGIPVTKHKALKVYNHTMVFGMLRTSSNFGSEVRGGAGCNGLGAKLCNILSSRMCVTGVDARTKKVFEQEWTNNMRATTGPRVRKATPAEVKGGDVTSVTMWPDLSRFPEALSLGDEFMAVLRQRCAEASACSGLPVRVNGDPAAVCSVEALARALPGCPSEGGVVIHAARGKIQGHVAVVQSAAHASCMAFVNGLRVCKGTHVEWLMEHIGGLVRKRGRGGKPPSVTSLKRHLHIVLSVRVENPTFEPQVKTTLTSPAREWGMALPKTLPALKALRDPLHSRLAAAEDKAAVTAANKTARASGAKQSGMLIMDKLHDATAGPAERHKCTLILTEGDSALTTALSGLSVVGRKYWGAFPLRGKVVNTRGSGGQSRGEANAEITALASILGLQFGKPPPKKMRYGRVLIMADQDVDGSHIKGLVLNMLATTWPALLTERACVGQIITPIIKVTRRKRVFEFFTRGDYEAWAAEQGPSPGTVKYYKGLGTSTPAEAREYFRELDKHIVMFEAMTAADEEALSLAFAKDSAEGRRQWLEGADLSAAADYSSNTTSIHTFVTRELVHFSWQSIVRSVPHLMDGLKESQRKILHGCLKRKLHSGEVKVAQLAGHIAEHCGYHHGESGLAKAIIVMAQDFVGRGNLPLLLPIGQFGSRRQGGQDQSAARYVNTRLSPMVPLLFHPADAGIAPAQIDDGEPVEPEWMPCVVPLLLINGSNGIGTGWSCSMPPHNPTDVVRAVRAVLQGRPAPELTPWYAGFTGEVVPHARGWSTRGVARVAADGASVHIVELPVGKWTDTYTTFLNGLMGVGKDTKQAAKRARKGAADTKSDTLVQSYAAEHTDTTVDFQVRLTPHGAKEVARRGVHAVFKLESTVAVHAHAICPDHTVQQYTCPRALIETWVQYRMPLYADRQRQMLQDLYTHYTTLSEKARFILAIVEGDLVVRNRPLEDVKTSMAAMFFLPMGSPPSLSYLLNMPMHSLTRERVAQLEAERDAARAKHRALMAQQPVDLWMQDLQALEDALPQHMRDAATLQRAAATGAGV